MSLTEPQAAPSSQSPQITAQCLAGERGEQMLTLGHNRHAKSLDRGCGKAVPPIGLDKVRCVGRQQVNPSISEPNRTRTGGKDARRTRQVDCVALKQSEAAHILLKKVLRKRKTKGLQVDRYQLDNFLTDHLRPCADLYVEPPT